MEKIFANGLIIKTIDTQFGEMKKLSVKVEDFKEFLDTYDNNGWVNLDIKKSKDGKEYIELNTYKPKQKSDDISIEDLPFN